MRREDADKTHRSITVSSKLLEMPDRLTAAHPADDACQI